MKRILITGILPLLLAALLLLPAFANSVYDVDDSGEIDINDVTVLLNALAGSSEGKDVDGNGTVDINDVTVLLDALSAGVQIPPSEGLAFTLNDDGESYSVTGMGECSDTVLVIPETYNGKPVTKIGEWAFSGCADLTSVTIPDSVTSIGEAAFYDCPSLEIVTIGNGVATMDDGAICYCESLTSVTIPDSVTSIGEEMFNGCSNLEHLFVASGNTKYHSSGNCIIETESKTLIAGCKNSVIPTDGSVTSIGQTAFYDCAGLTSIVFPESVTKISAWSFEKTGLTNVIIPGNIEVIEWFSFSYCSSLSSVTLPLSVCKIEDGAFRGCTSLDTIYYAGSAEQWSQISIDGDNDPLKNATIVYNYEG